MSISISNNISSLESQRQINKQTGNLTRSFEKLSSGKAINRASDDPAGLAVALDLLANANTSSVASRNISDGYSIAAIADSGLGSASDITSRMSELATQAANGTLSATQRSALNNEYQQLRTELDRIATTTEFNGNSLLSQNSTIAIQAGTSGNSNSQVNLNLISVSTSSLGLASDISTQDNARQAIEQTKSALENISQSRGSIGALESRLDSAFENIKTSELNSREASSRILDVDVAKESAKLVANQIGLQASASINAQANILPQLALKLLS